MAETTERVALVTGAGRGLGAAICEALAADGFAVVATARRLEAAEEVAARIREQGGKARAAALDVIDGPQAEATVADVVATEGRLDVLVNNAGVIEPIGPLADTDAEAWARTIEINLTGSYRMARAAIRHFRGAGGGRIVNISSGAARTALEGWSAYCSSKAGLAMLSQAIQADHAADGVQAFGFAPGLVDTDMQATIRASGINRVSRLDRSALRPAEEPARMTAYLVSGEADDLAGRDVDARDPDLRARAGLDPLGE